MSNVLVYPFCYVMMSSVFFVHQDSSISCLSSGTPPVFYLLNPFPEKLPGEWTRRTLSLSVHHEVEISQLTNEEP